MHYANIKNCDIANGEGVRVTLFVSGCTNHCEGCFQPETWDFDYGTFNFEYQDGKYDDGSWWYPTEKKMYDLYIKDAIWYKHLFNNAKMKELAKERWAELKPKFETMPAFIREQAEYIKVSAAENFRVWPMTTGLNYDENLSYSDAVEKMAGVVETRIKNMDEAFKKW